MVIKNKRNYKVRLCALASESGPLSKPILQTAQLNNQHANVISLENDDYCNPSHSPSNLNLPKNFNWVFIHGVWTLVLTKFSQDFTSSSLIDEEIVRKENIKIWSEEIHTDEVVSELGAQGSKCSGHDGDSLYSHEVEDSESDFEEKIRRLLQSGQTDDTSQGARKREPRKKPSAIWNEEAGFIPQPPRSIKKKEISCTTP